LGNSATQWNNVYDLSSRTIHLRTASNPMVRQINIHSLTFDYESKQRQICIEANQEKLDQPWPAYTPDVGFSLMRAVFDESGMGASMPDDLIEFLCELTDHRKIPNEPGL
jgi:hypothetical protein